MKNQIDLYDGVNEYLKQCKRILDSYDDLILFGASRTGEKVYSFLESIGQTHKLCMVVDNDQGKYGQKFHGFFVCNRLEMETSLGKYEKLLIMIASGSAHIIMRQLEEEGVEKSYMEPFPFGFIETDPTPYEYINSHLRDVLEVMDLLDDNKSKKVYCSLLNYKMTRKKEYLSGIVDDEKEQYFGDGFFKLGEEESIVDCGAYIGDTLMNFDKKLQGWKRYTCIEADKNVYSRLVNYIKESKIENVHAVQCGCWNVDGYASFEGSNSETGRIIEINQGTEIIETKRLDSLFADEKVTFLKMDIEGAEMAALEGASLLIERERPILAISIYHSLEDFVMIPKYLIQRMKNYRFYIRHYRKMSDSETILYAIPKERATVKVSIIMPLYNAKNTLERTLEHMKEQLTEGFEIICVDDASIDDTETIIKEYMKMLPIRYIRLPERVSVGAVRNVGLEEVRGDKIFFCDGDDLCFLNSILMTAEKMDEAGVDIAVVEYIEYDWLEEKMLIKRKGIRNTQFSEVEEIMVNKHYHEIFQLTNTACWNKIFRRQLLYQKDIRFPETNYLEDFCFVFKAILNSEKVLFQRKVCYCYTIPQEGKVSMLASVADGLEHYYHSLENMRDWLQEYTCSMDRNQAEALMSSAAYAYINLFLFAEQKYGGKWNESLASQSWEILKGFSVKGKGIRMEMEEV